VNGRYLVEGTAYHLVDCCEPTETYSAARFAAEARAKVLEIESRGATPLFVGGTGFYYTALCKGLAPLPSADDKVRARLRAFAEAHGRPALHAQLREVDPRSAESIPANNIARVVRALEVYALTGRALSSWHAEHQTTAAKDTLALDFVGIDIGREALNERLEHRCRAMVEEGMIEETQALLSSGVAEDGPALTGLGYPLAVRFLKGELSKEEMVSLLTQETRQYAKRQMTWFRNQFEVSWKKSLP
jgi:tRNA dimethylallyltransferase